MTQTAIQTQLDAITKTTAMATQSKETANRFLIDAGIKEKESSSTKLKTKSKK